VVYNVAVTRRRSAWTVIPRTPASYRYSRVERGGVGILCVRLSGYADNNPGGVARITDGLDALARSRAADLEVATLDVTAFCNADDDACSILTSAFAGLPCCWVTSSWDQQCGGRRWDLPPSERMAPTIGAAIARVIAWRRAGGFTITTDSATRAWRWTERGLVVSDSAAGVLQLEDLWHRNRLVERTIHRSGLTHVLSPFPDRSGGMHEALRRRARLVITGGQVVEVDFGPESTCRPLPKDWPELLAELAAVEILRLRHTGAHERDILRAVQILPALRSLEIGRASPGLHEQLRQMRPSLIVR
jgi:hypothetical protein